jgi:hypothetical protein
MTNPTEPAPFSVGDIVRFKGSDFQREYIALPDPPDEGGTHTTYVTNLNLFPENAMLVRRAVYAPPEMADPIVVSRAALLEELRTVACRCDAHLDAAQEFQLQARRLHHDVGERRFQVDVK